MTYSYKLMRLKSKAHKELDALWKSRIMDRGRVYALLKTATGIQHISECDEKECLLVIDFIRDVKSGNYD